MSRRSGRGVRSKAASDRLYLESINSSHIRELKESNKAVPNEHKNFRDITGEWEQARKDKAKQLANLWFQKLAPTILDQYQ